MGPFVVVILLFFLNPTGHEKENFSLGENTDMGFLDNSVGIDMLQEV